MSFLGAGAPAHPTAIIVGVPYDATSTFRRGSALGPQAIRWASQSIETYSPILRRDLEALPYVDRGDLEISGLSPEAMAEAVRTSVAAVGREILPVLIGGEHTLTLGAVQALAGHHRDLCVLQLDAHTDLRDEYDGHPVSHATVMRRVAEVIPPERIIALGIRAGTREEFALAERYRVGSSRLALTSEVWTWLQDRPVYVTVDIDVVDPSDAPGTGNPEPEGIGAGELLRFVRRLADLRVVGLDLVEVSPPYDPSGRTAVLAATIIREALLALRGT
ncbi:MAG TPA: agmatinase [bacterium]|nr:agmatinase [bacterium]